MAYPYYDDPEQQALASYLMAQGRPDQMSMTGREAGTMAGSMVPGTGLMDALGIYPAGDQGFNPSVRQNLGRGEYLDAMLQLLGAGGDLAMATGVGVPVGMTMKSAAAAGKGAKAARNMANAPQAKALELARQRGALPIDQGGLGLPTNNTPMDRAKAMGWDVGTDYIHVGNEPINAINNTGRRPGIFSLQNDSAENYGKISSPFMLRGKVAIDDDLQNYTLKDLKYATGSTGKKAKEELNYAIRDEIPPDSEDIAEAVERMQNIRMRLAKSMGHPAVKMADEFSNTVALLPGSSVRSRFAAFDPMRRDEPNLLAGAIPFTPFLATDEEQRNSLMQSLGMN